MTFVPDRAEHEGHRPGSAPAEDLNSQVRNVLGNAVDAHQKNLKVYESLRNLNEVVGTEYGDRVLYELIQNAHDAHRAEDQGRIAVRLVVRSETDGTLYVANGGSGFRREDLDAIENLATTAKEIGESIGNKGLGFRSIEALSDDVRIFSRRGRSRAARFDGYCFRFATVDEIEVLLRDDGIAAATARDVAKMVPRYLVPLPLAEQPDDVVSYARRGYATTIVVPLRTAGAIELAERQVQALANLDVPLLLFLDRIAEFRIDVETPDAPVRRRRLSRQQTAIGDVPGVPGCRLYEVRLGEDRRFLVLQSDVDKAGVLDAVERSVSKAPQLKRWLEWKGQPIVSVAVGLSPGAVATGRLYNFLPMGDATVAPLLGHLDAPFFAGIDRRDADFDLPLNATLMKAAAEACARAALHIAGQASSRIPQRAVFDLVAWTGLHARKLDAALNEIGSSLQDAPVVPTIAVGGSRWASLSEVSVWPTGRFSLMKAAEVAKRTGARLASAELDSGRLERLAAMATREYLDLSPSGEELAEWSEGFARSLADGNAAIRTWSSFYEDLKRVFDATGEDLDALSGKMLYLDRSKKLQRAGANNAASGNSVFVRSESTRRKRAKDGVPLPPATLTRRYRFLHEQITFPHDTLNAFIAVGLVREFDPVEALAGLGAALGTNANDNRRREALGWAFHVWRTAGAGIQEALRRARLRVPTLSGWLPATQAAFSSSWTPVGLTLENFLVEATDKSPDCRRTRDTLLVDFTVWPPSPIGTKRQWIDFLTLLGVVDGLRPVAGSMEVSDQGWSWRHVAQTGDDKEALDGDWCKEASNASFRHPYTVYRRKGAAWRLPGQIEHTELPGTAKEAFHELAFRHLETYHAEYMTFDVGRFDRPQRDWDRQTLPTPLATFLRSQAWIAGDTREESRFRKASQCWAARTRQGRPPRFMGRVPDTVAGLLEGSQELADLVFGSALGLRDWQKKDTAVERLQELATVSPTLAPHDRRDFRREYRRAWRDVSDTDTALPRNLDLAVNRDGRLEMLRGDIATAPTVILTQSEQAFEAKILSSTRHALLDIGDASGEKIGARLAATGRFTPRQLDNTGVQFLVDGEPFAPRTSDPLLTSLELDWLPEVVLLGHDILTEGFVERGVERTTVERRIRAIRVRRCRAITLVVDEDDVSPKDSLPWYGFEHPDLPTLILCDSVPLSWSTLGRDLSRPVSRLIDKRLRFLEPLLLRLALDQVADTLDAPSDEELAGVLGCDAETLQEHRAALRTDLGHILHLLMPVVANFGDVELARQLKDDAEHAGVAFNVLQWLRSRLAILEIAPEDILEACERASDRAALRRELGLDYELFNQVLMALGEPPISNESELRSMYDAYVQQMSPRILERLRKHHAADFRNGRDLTAYADRKTLSFLEFDPAWILSRETLDHEIVDAHVMRLLDEILGEDHEVELPPSRGLVEGNRKSVRRFASRALSAVGAWCRRNHFAIQEPWRSEDPQSVARHLENAGLLDFEPVYDNQLPGLCARAACWPSAMPQTLDPGPLGLDQGAVEEEERRREKERQRSIIEQRSIEFAGTKLDTGDPSFADSFRQLAENSIAGDHGWLKRSRRPRLAEIAELDGGGWLPAGRTGGGAGRSKQPPEVQRQAMGLASEWLVFQFLRRRYGDAVDETCWVSTNRARFFGGHEGDDAAGYDFCIKTPQVEWHYEVKSSLEDTCEFELTPNEMRVATSMSRRGRRRYRILYVPFVFSPDRWFVLELPNPMDERTRNRFKQVGRGSVRFRFERSTAKGTRS